MSENNSEQFRFEGELTFDINSGSFWITKEEAPVTQLKFGDEFEVKDENGSWVKTAIEISSDSKGDLIFKLKNTNYEGILDGVEVRM